MTDDDRFNLAIINSNILIVTAKIYYYFYQLLSEFCLKTKTKKNVAADIILSQLQFFLRRIKN